MTSDQVAVALIAAGWSLGVGVVGALVGWRIRRAPIRWSAGLIAVVAVGGVVAGVVGTARAMFLSTHDLGVVVLVCGVSGLVSAVFALFLARALTQSARRLRVMAAAVGSGTAGGPGSDTGSGTTSDTTPNSGAEWRTAPADPAELRAVADELARSSEQLRTAQARERQLEKSRRELVAWVSHDLRTPLAGIRAMAEALDDGIATDPRRYHRQMLKEADRMTSMVDDLFELSRIHSGALNLTLQPMALRDVVSEGIAGAIPVARSQGIEVGGHVVQDVEVRADAAALSRVVGNLVMNAIRHTPADGVVLVEGRTCGDTVELTVTDGCGGIDPDDLSSVFEVGWRGTQARTPGPDTGAGLGLAIVRGLVEAHEGTVAVSNHGGGCRFVVRLPA